MTWCTVPLVTAEQIAAELKAIREKLDLSQEEMARKFPTTLRTYQRWEAGEGVKLRVLQQARTFKKRGA